jgi:methyl-accepting chemotaxis protein
MNRRLQFINFFGVVVLTVLCVAQWQANRRLNLQMNRLEKIRIQQSAKLEEQSKKIKGYVEDLEDFREHIDKNGARLKEQTEKARSAEATARRLSAECEQLKSSVSNWANAVNERDARLKENSETIRVLTTKANGAVEKFNQLATNYNSVVKDLNALRAREAKKESGQK